MEWKAGQVVELGADKLAGYVKFTTLKTSAQAKTLPSCFSVWMEVFIIP